LPDERIGRFGGFVEFKYDNKFIFFYTLYQLKYNSLLIETDISTNESDSVVDSWDVIRYLPESLLPLQVRIFMGGKNSMQVTPFMAAVADQNYDINKITFTYVSVREVKRFGWTPEEFVEWLLGSHVHFILSHVHQGLERLQWNMSELLEQLKRLKDHNGFPNGNQLECPIFTQDKFEYIKAVPIITNETLRSNQFIRRG